ncbi:hypothetical protein G7077_03440 [Sphingomonas piscis]|uniref:Uncharacterized protein n=1 Tax=Sphingomonas piscis TaxID=2714943 RepID=A0A6G7YMZ1_9SPHN|nr:DUF6694 family lipoprotein [Sphingomonas piscis]QIK78108.1 hypothetical protein G7077_03440 [Sphingomonas piscis]
MKWTVGVLLLFLAGCHKDETVLIDGSSKESFETTSEKARRTIPDADRLVFDRALRTVGGRRFGNRDPEALARVTFDGMTAAQVVADQRAHELGAE